MPSAPDVKVSLSEIGSVWNVAVMPDYGYLLASKNLIVNSPSTFNVSDVIAMHL
jgi:hypothetical protein